jgi:AmmeMemoRadiSam system protein B
MATPLAPLRSGLDLMPSPVPDRPGLLIRDPLGHAESTLIIPPPLVPCLTCFDGVRTELDARELLVRQTGELQVGDVVRNLVEILGSGGFLDNDVFDGLREARHRAFAEAQERVPAHAGSAYPAEEGPLRETLGSYLDGSAPGESAATGTGELVAIVAPHVSPDGGRASYRAAYRALEPGHRERTFVILGTSHYGDPELFGLTRKPFVTPLGRTQVDQELVARLAETAGPAARMEDFCHSVEHSIEFQVVFLQLLFGPDIRILPILCGPFARATQLGGRPEDDTGVARFLEAIEKLVREEEQRLLWVLGIDMSHMGRRYGDSLRARAAEGEMASVERRDRERIERLAQGDAEGFWALVQEGGDPLKWCGSAPCYAFLRANGPVAGELLRYDQWNIDDDSVVSFAGMAFRRAEQGAGKREPAAS